MTKYPNSVQHQIRDIKSFIRLFVLLLTFASNGAAPQTTPARPNATIAIDHVIVISVDGLRSDALMVTPKDLPGFTRLMTGSSTMNARTDPDYTTTLPNHVGMVTSRVTNGDAGHLWTTNSLVAAPRIIHDHADRYVASMFDVAHDHGVRTALLATKEKFIILDLSYDAEHGAADQFDVDNGRDKIDHCEILDSESIDDFGDTDITDLALTELAASKGRSLLMLHYSSPDCTGHTSGWNLSPDSEYMKSVRHVDEQISRLLGTIEKSDHLRGRTAIILTSDHGGGAPHKSHTETNMWVNYIIPFIVWTGDDRAADDLYAINAESRFDPSLKNPPMSAPQQPIRNADAGNLALSLLQLPAISGSTANARQDLQIRPMAGSANATPHPQVNLQP